MQVCIEVVAGSCLSVIRHPFNIPKGGPKVNEILVMIGLQSKKWPYYTYMVTVDVEDEAACLFTDEQAWHMGGIVVMVQT